MPQLSKGVTYAPNNQVTSTNLNNLVDQGKLDSGAIGEQTVMPVNVLVGADEMLVRDVSANASTIGGQLRRLTITNFLASNLPATHTATTTETLNSKSDQDVRVVGSTGTAVPNISFNSTGTVVTCVSPTHNLVSGMVLSVTSTSAGISGLQEISVSDASTFTFNLREAGTATSGTLTYTRQPNANFGTNVRVANSAFVDGEVVVEGATTLKGNMISTGTANFTGAVQFNGAPVYGFYGIDTLNLPTSGIATTAVNTWVNWASLTGLNKPAEDLWIIDLQCQAAFWSPYSGRVRVLRTSNNTVLGIFTTIINPPAYPTYYTSWHATHYSLKIVVPAGEVWTNEGLAVQATSEAQGGVAIPAGFTGLATLGGTGTSNMIISKFKTA
jgi:hypothetical protein